MDSKYPDRRGVLESLGLVNSAPISETPRRNLVRWLLLAVCLAAGVNILAGRSPERFAMPVLFPLGFGLLYGLALGEMSRILLLTQRRLLALVAGLLAVAALGGVTAQWYVQYREKTAAAFRENQIAKDMLADKLEAALKVAPKGETAEQRKTRLEMQASFAESAAKRQALENERKQSLTFEGYLRERWAGVNGMKNLARPWPLLIWGAELLVAGLLAGMFVWTATKP